MPASVRQRLPFGLVPIAFAIGLVVMLGAASARADYEPIGSGAIKLSLAKSFLAACRVEGVKLSVAAPAKFSAGVVTMPAVGGKFDPVAAKGTIEGEGALVLSANGRSVPIKAVKVRTTQKRSPFTAKVGGSQLKLATATRISVNRDGFDDKVSVVGLSISSTLATRLGKKLDLRKFFKAGTPFATASVVATPATIGILEQGDATLTLDPGFVAKLQSLFVAVNPIFPAEHQGPVFTLPVFGGMISPSASAGRLETSGVLEFLQLGGGQIFWREPLLELESRSLTAEVDTEPSPPYPGKAGRLAIATLAMSGSATPDPSARTVSAGFTLTLEASMAQAFEEAFARPQGKSGIFVAGEPLGTVGFTARGQ